MQTARIAELLAPYLDQANDRGLTDNDLQNISTYIDILQRWNARMNLTAVRSEEEIVTRHFGESLFAARHLFPVRAGAGASQPSSWLADDQRLTTNDDIAIADVGSGAGFPGIPIKLWAPAISLTLIESNHKKAAFLKELTRTLTLTDVDIQTVRAESLPASSFEVVTLRAVERFETILPVAARLVAPKGRLALLIGSPQIPTAQSALPDLAWSAPKPMPGSQSRVLAIATTPRNLELNEPNQ